MTNTLNNYINQNKLLINNYISDILQNSSSELLLEAMRYAVLNGGKRLRGLLVLLTFQAVNNNSQENINKLLPVIAGIEYIHAMSLVHDDLPCMDNDDYRRGKPATHKQYNEAIALLAGDTLLIEGIALINNSELENNIKIQVLNLLLQAIGKTGMCAGQALDLEYTENNTSSTVQELNNIHQAKTVIFLINSIKIGALIAGASPVQVKALEIYGKNIGLAFQITDDILDIEGQEEILGKTIGKDIEQDKLTYPKLLGLEKSKQKAQELIVEAKDSIKNINIKSELLSELADYIINRKS